MFSRSQFETKRDRDLGKHPSRVLPWLQATPQEKRLTRIEDVARGVMDGQRKFSREDIHKILASYVLRDG